MGIVIMDKKAYIGYKPKDINVVKLSEYMRVKNKDKRVTSPTSGKSIQTVNKNSPLKNKKF